MHKLMFIGLIVLFLPSFVSATSLGIWPAKINATVLPFRTTYVNMYLFNPGDKDIEVEVGFTCDGKNKNIINELSVNVYPEALLIEKNTTQFEPKEILVSFNNHLFIKKVFSSNFFGIKINIPFYKVIFNKNVFECMITASTINEKTPIIVTSKVDIELFGINSSKFIILLSFSLLLLFVLSYWYYRKLKDEKR